MRIQSILSFCFSFKLKWCARRESNPLPEVLEAFAIRSASGAYTHYTCVQVICQYIFLGKDSFSNCFLQRALAADFLRLRSVVGFS